MNKEKRPANRPRTVSLPIDEMTQLGKEMLLWIKNNPETIHLSEWYTIEKGFIYNDWKTFIQRKEFIPYYERALKIIGLQYLKKDSPIEPNLKQRWQRVYFKDIRDEEDDTKTKDRKELHELEKKLAEFIHTMKKEMTETVSEDVKAQFDSLMNQISSMKKK